MSEDRSITMGPIVGICFIAMAVSQCEMAKDLDRLADVAAKYDDDKEPTTP